MSAALVWKPNGVSRSTPWTGPGPRRSTTARWTLIMVGAVSPEPMMVSRRGRRVIGSLRTLRSSARSARFGAFIGKGGGQGVDDLPLQHAQVVVDGELGG